MGIIKTIAVAVLGFSFLLFVALFGRLPLFRRTPIGFLHRLIWIHTPKLLSATDNLLTGGRFSRSLNRTGDYLMNEAHPIVLIFFLLLLSIAELLFIPTAYTLTTPLHRILMPLIILPPYLNLYLCVTSSSPVTPTTLHSAMTAYPYDHLLYPPGLTCRTCHLPKPPRSKHCSLCKTCVQRQDHHCIWINNCVGRSNYIYFLALLLSISLLLAYGTWLGYTILSSLLQSHFVPAHLTRGSLTSKHWSTGLSWVEYANRLLLAVAWEWRIGAVTLLMFFSFPLSTGFFAYHVYLLWAGMTTNESNKWADWREDVADGLVFRAEKGALRGDWPRLGEELEPVVDGWPGGEGRWWVVRTRGGMWPRKREREEEDRRWERVESLTEVENIYDIGFWGTLSDVVFNRE